MIFVVDLDGTLYPHNTFHRWLKDLMLRGLPWSLFGAWMRVSLATTAALRLTKRIDHAQMKRRILIVWERFETRHPKQAEAVIARFAQDICLNCQPNAKALFQQARDNNVKVVLATAAPEVYAKQIAAWFTCDHYIASPRVAGTENWAETLSAEKLRHVQSYLAENGFDGETIVMFTDHPDDRPMCNMADMVVWFGTTERYHDMALDTPDKPWVLFTGDMIAPDIKRYAKG